MKNFENVMNIRRHSQATRPPIKDQSQTIQQHAYQSIAPIEEKLMHLGNRALNTNSSQLYPVSRAQTTHHRRRGSNIILCQNGQMKKIQFNLRTLEQIKNNQAVIEDLDEERLDKDSQQKTLMVQRKKIFSSDRKKHVTIQDNSVKQPFILDQNGKMLENETTKLMVDEPPGIQC